MTGHDVPYGSGVSTCPGCGLTAAEAGEPAPEEHSASAACWAVYGQLLARSYTDPDYRAVHQVLVDAYAAQHAGGSSRREVQSVSLCLMTLCLFVEDGVDPAQGPALHKEMVAHRPDFTWLAPPDQRGLMTVADVLSARDADEHRRLVREWGREVWRAWAPHHPTIRAWNAQALTARKPGR
jgi:Family of unknown function (DUF5946)